MTVLDLTKKYNFLRRIEFNKNVFQGREEELQLLKESMFKKRFKNSILVGEAGAGKTAIIEEFARLNANDIVVLELSLAHCVSGTKYRGDFEEKMVNCLDDVIQYNNTHKSMPIILFIDEIHTIIKVGESEGAISASNIIKPYLSKTNITIIGATTNTEYEATIKNDAAIKRRLSPIFIESLEKETIIDILNEFACGKIGVSLLEYIYQKSLTINNSCNPDISIEILDRCLARKKVTGKTITKTMIDSIIKYLNES